MMERLPSMDKDVFDVTLSGGSPWGFTLHGGSEFNTKLYIKRITPGGKASNSRLLEVGDEVLSINNIKCTTRAKAIEYVKQSGQNLQLTVKRANNDVDQKPGARENGVGEKPPTNRSSQTYNATVIDSQQKDFYSTYSVDPDVYDKIVLKTRGSVKDRMSDSYDSELSASNEDLLDRYRKRKPGGSEEELDNVESSDFTNGRVSPGKELSGRSLPESQLHGRTFTTPGRIEKVTIKSTNISSSSSSTFNSPEGDGTRHQSRVSPVKHSPIVKQYHVEDKEPSSEGDNWFYRWLRDDKSLGNTADKDMSVKDACSKYEQERQQQQQAPPKSPVMNRSNFSRSKSFSGRPSYGVVFGTTAVKSNTQRSEITAYQAPLPSTRYNSSELLRDKARQNIPAESWKPVETSPRQTDDQMKYEMRMNRKSLGAYPLVTSTTSLDSFNDSRRQGPAIPPRRSESKLLRSMRRGKSQHTGGTTRESYLKDEQNRPKHSVSNSWPSDFVGVSTVSDNRQSWPQGDEKSQSRNKSDSASGPKRSTSVVIRSVKTSSDGKPTIYRSSSVEIKPDYETNEGTRSPNAQSARPQSAQTRLSYSQQQQQQQQQPVQYQAAQQTSSRQSQYQQQQRSPLPQQQQQQRSPPPPPQQQWSPPPQYQQQQRSPPPQYQQQQQSPPPQQQRFQHQYVQQPVHEQEHHETRDSSNDMLSSRIEDTQILQKLMQDNQVLPPPRRSVRSRIQTIEKCYSQPNLADGAGVYGGQQLRPGAHHHKQRSWDNSYSAFNRTFSNAKSELRATGRFGSTERLLDTKEYDEPEQSETSEEKLSPVKVTSRELAATAKTAVMQTTTITPSNEKIAPPLNEQVLRTESSSLQEKEVLIDEMFKTLESKSAAPEARQDTKQETNNNLTTKTQQRLSKFSVGDDDVFTNSALDESLPPPPPMTNTYHDNTDDNLPLPTPPREVLVSVPVVRTGTKQDRNRNVIHDNQQQTKRHSFTENRPKENSTFSLDNEEDPDKGDIGTSVTVKNSKNEELSNEKRTDNYDNYIAADDHSSPSPKERSFVASTIPSKIELDTTETAISKEPPSPIVITSTPTRNDSSYEERTSPESDNGGNTSPISSSSLSTPSSSRPGSMMSPKLEQLDKEKCQLVDSMRKKIQDLRTQMNEISDEIAENEKLGEKVTALVEEKATPSEFSKYQRFTGELNKIVLLLLSLTQRMHRYENTLQELDMSEEADRQQRDVLLDKIDHVKSQYEEACKIKEVNDKRGQVVSGFLENYFDEDEFADFQYYIDMKTQLALMHAEIKDKVKMGEERLNTLTSTAIDWNTTSFCNY